MVSDRTTRSETKGRTEPNRTFFVFGTRRKTFVIVFVLGLLVKSLVSSIYFETLPYDLATIPLLGSTSLETKEEIGIVVGHCKEDIRYLDDFGSCDRIRIHIYSPCGGEIPEFKKVQGCVTVHRGKDCARETYAYFEFVREYYDSLPSMVAFIQGSGITGK
jgi:hypothetical protein